MTSEELYNMEEIQEKVSLQNEMSKYYVDQWYNSIQQFTFKTVLIPLDIDTAQSIVRFHYQRYGNKSNEQKNDNDNSVNETLTAYNILKAQINKGKDFKLHIPNDINQINTLNERMRIEIQKYQKLWNNKKLFVRLSNRSSKDGDKIYKTNKNESAHHLYQQKLKRIKTENKCDDNCNENDLLNYEMIACMECIYDDLWIDNSHDLVSLLLTSNRIYFDLMNHLIVYYSNNDEKEWNINIGIREFNDNLCDELEFRCFVYGSELTAISQYNKYCYYDTLNENKDDIESVLINYWLKISKHIHYEDYVVDMALIQRTQTDNECQYECVVIEINPFSELTSGCLFDWSIDKGTLKGSNIGEIVFKIHEKEQFQKYCIVNKNTVQLLLKKYNSRFDQNNNISWMEYLQTQQQNKKECIML